MGDTNHGIIRVVVLSIAIMAGICICALSWCLVTGREMEQSTGMAYFGVTNALIGYLAGCLSKTTATPTGPTDAKIVNEKSDPIPTSPQ